MSRRKALAVAGAVGPETGLNQALNRFGFDNSDTAPTVADALKRIHQSHFDLLVIPLEQIDQSQLASVERELRREPTTTVIGTGPTADPELILRGLRAGVHEYLVRPPKVEDIAAALDRLTRRVPANGKHGFVVAVYSAKGGLGVTTIAINLAYALARHMPERRVVLADLVTGDADVRLLLNLKTMYDIGDLVARKDHVDSDVLYSVLTERPGGVWILPASDKPETTEMLDAAAATTIVGHLRNEFGLVVLDTEDHLSERTVAALDAADRIVLVTQLTIPALKSTQQAISLFRRLGYNDDKILVVVNRYHSREPVTLSDARTVLEHDVACALPNDYQDCAKAVSKGIPLMELDPDSRLAEQFMQLAVRVGNAAADTTSPAPPPGEPMRAGGGVLNPSR